MKTLFTIIFLLQILQFAYSFSILGTWKLKQIQDYPVISENVQMTLEDMIFRQKQIQQVILFKGCRTYRYMSQIAENNIYINFNTFNYVNQSEIANCLRQISLMHSQIQQKLKSIFKFNIIGNNLALLDAKRNVIMRFQRKIISNPINLKGQWNIFRMNSRRIQDKIYFTDSQIFLCQNKLKYSYNITGKYQIKTKLINNNGCNSQELQQTLSAVEYFRKVNNTLEMYDKKIKLKIQFLFFVDNTSSFTILQNTNTNIKKNFNNIQAISSNKLIGKWQPFSIFNSPLQSTPIKIIFTQNQISFNGGCNKYTFQYTLDSIKNKINLGKRQSTSNICQNDEDGLYINAIWKITKYTVNNNGTIKLTDALGKSLYQLKNIDQNQITKPQFQPQNNSQQKILINQISKLNTSQTLNIQNGRYVFLLTNRRDLPRKFCNINSGKFICEGCNSIENIYKLIKQSQIQISGQIVGNKVCSNNNDQIFLKTISSFQSFQKSDQLQGYQFKDINNQLVGYLSLS